MKNHEQELKKKDFIIKQQQEKLLELQMKILKLEQSIPTGLSTQKKQFERLSTYANKALNF